MSAWDCVLPPTFTGVGFRLPPADSSSLLASCNWFNSSRLPALYHKRCTSSFWMKNSTIDTHPTKIVKVRASQGSGDNITPIAPLQLESPTGQLLSQILQTHPHLLPAAIDQQLETLQTERDSQKGEKPHATQDLLNKRIAELKDKERKTALEDILYCLIVQKFMENGIYMIPPISSSSRPVDSWPNQEQKLERMHSPDALEMIQSHLSLILGERVIGPLNPVVQISKLKLGKLYAASIMYGYFLKRVDERYQLERSMNTLPKTMSGQKILGDVEPNPFWDMESLVQISPDAAFDGGDFSDSSEDGKSYRLRSYVMYLDAETLQRYATIRSKESISLIEKQTQALFGRPDIRVMDDGSLDISNDEVVGLSFQGLTMLVLEAVTFGSFLWDAEGYVEPKYHFLTSQG